MIPCTDSYKKVDLRTVSFDVPPQEVHEDDDNDDDDESLMKMTMSMLTMKMKSTLQYHHMKVLSRDSVTVTVDAVIYYRVSNPTMVFNHKIFFTSYY